MEKMRQIINYLCHKYNGNWEQVYETIKNKKDKIEISDLMMEREKNFIAIIDYNYPNNFKEIYMPPLILYYKGHSKLMNEDSNIISIWDEMLDDQVINQLNKTNDKAVFSFIYDNKFDKFYKKLLENGKKVILISNTIKPSQEILKYENNDNFLFISEVPFNVNKPSLDDEQTIERINLGVSANYVLINKNERRMKCINPLFNFEKKKLSCSRNSLSKFMNYQPDENHKKIIYQNTSLKDEQNDKEEKKQ